MNKNKRIMRDKKIVILGVDGMDPNLVALGWQKNLLPNLKKLKETGYYSLLETVIPPQSPVAWASFATGSEPSGHGVYDFIVCNPKNYQLDLVWSADFNKAKKARPFWEETKKRRNIYHSPFFTQYFSTLKT